MKTVAGAGLLSLLFMASLIQNLNAAEPTKPWPVEKAAEWQKSHPWLVGCNFIPSNAINQLEMWQADTFDPATNDRELGWAEDLGFTMHAIVSNHCPQMTAPVELARMLATIAESVVAAA